MAAAFDPRQAKLKASCEAPGILFGLCADPANERLFGAGTDGYAYVVNTSAETPTAEKTCKLHDNYVSSLAYRDGVIISGSFDRRIHWTQADDGKRTLGVDAHDGWVRDIALFPGGDRLVSVGDDMQVKVWHAETGKLLQVLKGHASQTPQDFATALYSVAVSPDGETIVSGDRIGDLCLWNTSDGKLIHKLQTPEFYTFDAVKRTRSIGGIRSVTFSPDGSQIAIGGIGQVTNVDGFVGPARVELWDWRKGKRLFTGQDNHKAVLNHVDFHPSQPWLIGAGGGDSGGVLAFWDRKSGKASHKTKPKGHLQQFLLSADRKDLWAVGHGGLQLWGFDAEQQPKSTKSDPGK